MSTQKAKFELFTRLQKLGFTYDEAAQLRRIEMTLQRWAEYECGDGNDYGSWSIERDEATDRPFMVHHHYLHGRGKDYVTRTPIADRETGALRRAMAIAKARNDRKGEGMENVYVYHQGDPRGCALYLVKESDVKGVETHYTNGLAVCA